MSKNRKRLMRSSLVMLIVAAVALSSATYAWFSSGNTGDVTSIEFTAQSASGIQISADALTWKSTLPASEIKTAQAGTLVGKMAPVSTTGSVDTTTNKGTITLYGASVVADGTITATLARMATQPETGDGVDGYYKFDLYFKNEGAVAKELHLKLDTSKVEASTTDKGIQNAVRVAFIDEGQGTGTTQTVDGVKAADGGNKCVIWEPNATVHTDYAKTYRYVVDATTGKPGDAVLGATNADVQTYVGIAKNGSGITAEKGAAIPYQNASTTYSSIVKTDDTANVTLATGSAANSTVKIAALPANKIAKVTVYVWIEGQDVDCNNAESGGNVVTNLKFEAKDVTG